MYELTRRGFLGLGGSGALALSGMASAGALIDQSSAHNPNPALIDPMTLVNPELRDMAQNIKTMTKGLPPLGPDTLELQRRKVDEMAASHTPSPLPLPVCVDRRVPGLKGNPEVLVHIINADASKPPRPAIVHIHGGGFVMGRARPGVRGLQEQAIALDCVIMTVEYRLAPETRFPGSLEDNYAALSWLFHNAGDLGVEPTRIAVMGESAGGGHAAMLAIAARDRGEIPLLFQALTYPMLDDRTGSSRLVPPYIGTFPWTTTSNRFGWSSLLGVPAGSARVPYGSVPARVNNLAGLPAAFIGVGSIDLFVNEDMEYARRLVDAGVSTELTVVPGAFHGFDLVEQADVVKQFQATRRNALQRAFAQG